MRALTVCLSLFVFTSCGGRSLPGGTSRADAAPPPAKCEAPVSMGSPETLADALGKLQWRSLGSYSSELLTATRDHVIGAPMELGAAQVKTPCASGSGGQCRPTATFVLMNPGAGVKCLRPEQVAYISGCARIGLAASTTLRFIGKLQDTHPGQYNFSPVIEVRGECKAACSGGQLRCARTNLCLGSFDEYCRLCQVKDVQTCACQTAQGAKQDGAQCSFPLSGDSYMGGACKQGRCEPSK